MTMTIPIRPPLTFATASAKMRAAEDASKAGDADGLDPSSSLIPKQQRRLAQLMRRWWEARDSGNLLPPNEQAELEALARVALRVSADEGSVATTRL